LRRVSATVLVGVSLALAACGGGDSAAEDFSQGYNEAIGQLGRVNQQLSSLGTARSNRAVARELDRFAEAAETTRAELSRLDPPERAAQQFDALVSALGDSIRGMRRAAAAARANTPSRYRRAVRQIRRATGELASAEDALRKAVERG
jgi:hypothetical protein